MESPGRHGKLSVRPWGMHGMPLSSAGAFLGHPGHGGMEEGSEEKVRALL